MAFYNLLKRLRLTVNPVLHESVFMGHETIRYPAPASQPEYISPVRYLSDVRYMVHEMTADGLSVRDVRRAYPQTTVYMNPTSPLLSSGVDLKSLPQEPGMVTLVSSLSTLQLPDANTNVTSTFTVQLPPPLHPIKTWKRSEGSALPTDNGATHTPIVTTGLTLL